jgi:hypothetical protein
MFSLTSIFSFFNSRTRMDSDSLDPAEILFDPNITLKPSLFLYTFISWASIAPSNSDTNPEDILSRFKVQKIMYNKLPVSPEHEFLVIETVDRSQETKLFILDRTVATRRQGSITPDPTADPIADPIDPIADLEAHRRKIINRLKRFLDALSALISLPSDSQLTFMEEGSPSIDPLSITDKATLSLTETADLISDSLDLSDNSEAFDRFLGQNHVNLARWQGETVGCLKPNNLTLFELVLLAHVAHNLFPNYARLKQQCYFYAGLIFSAVEYRWCKLQHADETDSVGSPCQPYKSGRWKGFKVKRVDKTEVLAAISKYDIVHSQTIDKVFLFIYDQSNYHLQHSKKIMGIANAHRDQTNWKKVKNIIDTANE